MPGERICVRCRSTFKGGTLLCPPCQSDALDAIAGEYPADTHGPDLAAVEQLIKNQQAQYTPNEETHDAP